MKTSAIVFMERAGETIPAGRLNIIEDGGYGRSEFGYGRRYLERRDAVPIDPVQLPLQEGVMPAPESFTLFNGIRDAAPDAWGRQLIEREALRLHGRPALEAEFLLVSQSGSRSGGLRFGPDPKGPGPITHLQIPDNLVHLGELAQFQEMVHAFHKDGAHLPAGLRDFLAPATDMGGARPKGTITIDSFPHLVKFGMPNDRFNMAAIEAGCLDLCEMADLQVSERHVIGINGLDALVVKRFDREIAENGICRKHMISAMTLLGAHEMDRGMSGYADILDGLRRHGTPGGHGEEIFRRMVMNVLCGNTDDHYRNTALLMSDQGRFSLSPVYDVTPTIQAVGTRHLFLHLGRSGSGREATLENALEAGPAFGLARDHACTIINELSRMVARSWRDVMQARGATDHDLAVIANSFSESGKIIKPDGPDVSL